MGDPTGGSIGDSMGGSMGEPIGGSTGDSMGGFMGEPTGEPTGDSIGDSTGDAIGDSMPIDQFCSFYNQKKLLIDFGRFLICNPCRQRNQKANQARHLKQKTLLNNKGSSS
jgi:hypothetical protein